MLESKKKPSSKKLKSNKSEASLAMPLSGLVNEINDLKQQLFEIKSKKAIRAQKDNQPISKETIISRENARNFYDFDRPQMGKVQYSPKSIDHNKTLQKFSGDSRVSHDIPSLTEIVFPVKEHELKVNIELNKLYRRIKDPMGMDCVEIVHQLNRITNFLNSFIEQREESLDNRKEEEIYPNRTPFDDQPINMANFQFSNKELEKQIIELKHVIATQADSLSVMQQSLQQKDQKTAQLLQEHENMLEELQRQKTAYEGLRTVREELQEKLNIFQKAVEQKQQEIIMLEEDISYNRGQSEKHKAQKKELEKICQQALEDYKIMKNKYENQVEAVRREKDKWKNECESRRLSENDILAAQEQKNILKKDLEQIRRQSMRKHSQINQLKSGLHEEQRKIINLEGENYHLTAENEKLKRSVQYCKQEMRILGQQVEQLRKAAQQNKSKTRAILKTDHKNQALDEIQKLIQSHRQAVLDHDLQ